MPHEITSGPDTTKTRTCNHCALPYEIKSNATAAQKKFCPAHVDPDNRELMSKPLTETKVRVDVEKKANKKATKKKR